MFIIGLKIMQLFKLEKALIFPVVILAWPLIILYKQVSHTVMAILKTMTLQFTLFKL